MKDLFFSQLRLNYLLLYLVSVVIAGCQNKSDSHSAEEALSTFELEPGFKVELVAAEPLISDPVDMEIDEYGRMYVVEMHGYPLDVTNTGRIKLLSDVDGDGKMDKSTIFADSLIMPTGVMRWKEGIIVTDAPDVLYLEDTDGDGKADIREVMLTGFALSNPQHNFNNPLFGLDNWIYLGNEGTVTTTIYKEIFGDSGKEVFYPNQPNDSRLPTNASGLNVRFRPDSRKLELLSSKTQFGQTFDGWGHHFLLNNSNHIYQEVIKASYLNRNPDLLVSSATQSLSDHGNAAEVFPITKDPEYQLLTNVGVFTSATGLTAYLGGAFPDEYNDNVTFVAEPVSNLVHADRLESQGASFTASRILENKEFLASTDSWFRPVNMYTGPDGALYVVDYYRQIIEHPEWMAEDVINSGTLYNGTDKGRIYRISASDAKPVTWTKQLELGTATNEQLVEKLADPNIWWRRNAQRLLVDRNSAQAVPGLVQMARTSTSSLGRLHAMWTLEGMDQLTVNLIEEALQDPEPGIRENAIKLAELHLDTASGLISRLLTLKDDDDPKVRYQLLCTLGFIDTPSVNQVRQSLLFKDINDPWVQTAALSASSIQKMALLDAVHNHFQKDTLVYASLTQKLGAMVGASQQPKEIKELLKKATATDTKENQGWQASVLKGLTQGLKSNNVSSLPDGQSLLVNAFFGHPSTSVREASLDVLQVIGLSEGNQTQKVMQRAKQMGEDVKLLAKQRAQAVRFLGLRNPATFAFFLQELVVPDEPPPVQLAALQTLSLIPDETVSHYVLQQWTSLTPEIRDVALNTFMSSRDRISLLLDAVESGKIQATNIGWPRSVSLMAGRWPRSTELMTQADLDLRDRARSLLTKKDDKRKEVVQKYQTALDHEGDKVRGKAVFQESCAICHQMGDKIGSPFGPDLTSIRNRRPASIMNDILDPNQSIADGYDLWVMELKSGETVQGIISTETPNAVSMVNVGGQQRTIARQNIQSLKIFDVSAMPSGLEKQISQQEMADLLAYLRDR